jgi:glycerophosphoryl diester phosphodiesterase
MMQIISHRGYWKAPEEKNTAVAFDRSFSLGFGTETDFRDYLEDVVISHDVANETSIAATRFFEIFNQYNPALPLALNIKADGLQKKLKALLEKYNTANYFVFDMSIPDTIGYIDHGIPFFSRQSEYEAEPAFYENCTGIWLDAFKDQWYDAGLIRQHVGNGKKVAVVSFDLHKRDHLPLWKYLKENELHLLNEMILCTDVPEEALTFFNN